MSIIDTPRPDNIPVERGRDSARRGRQRRQRVMWWVLGILLAAGLTAIGMASRKNASVSPTVKTVAVRRSNLVETISATGSVVAQTGAEVKVGSEVTGRIIRLTVDAGGHVHAGQLIAQLDVPDLVAQQRAAEDTLSQSEQKLQEAITTASMQKQQAADTIASDQQALEGALAHRDQAIVLLKAQETQTATDISRARSALSAARTTEAQARRAYTLQLNMVEATLRQGQATESDAAATLRRKSDLLSHGYVAPSDVDDAKAAEDSDAAQVDSDKQNVVLTRAADQSAIDTAHEQVVQAQQALTAALAETLQITVKNQDVASANASVAQDRAQLDSARAQLMQNSVLERQVTEARISDQAANEQVNVAAAQVHKSIIHSPISGTVLDLEAQQGETLVAGYTTAPLLTVVDLNRLQVSALVDETDIGKVRVGQPATVTIDAFPDQPFAGRVVKIASGSNQQSSSTGAITYAVTVSIRDPLHELKPDMTATVDITSRTLHNVLVLPNEALKPDNLGTVVGVIVPGKPAPVKRVVSTGATDGTITQVVSGLALGDKVALTGWSPAGTTAVFGRPRNQ
ncbi:MAG: efflux RND transporter periplasmic adaptor subunit [Capsulimonadaceae bacterium]